MAADAGERVAALRNLGGRIVWAARAEIGCAAERHDTAAELTLLRLKKGKALGDPRRCMKASNAFCDDARDLGRRQLAIGWQYPVAVLVEFADDPRPDVF